MTLSKDANVHNIRPNKTILLTNLQNKTTILTSIIIQLKCSKNEKEFKQYSKLKAYLVFIRMFNVLGQILVST